MGDWQLGSPDEIRAKVLAGVCPVCGAHRKVIAMHTNKVHGIDRRTLREVAGLPWTRSLLDDSMAAKYSAKSSAQWERYEPQALSRFVAGRAAANSSGRSARRSAAGRAAVARASQRSKTPETRQRISAARRRINAARDTEILRRLSRGESGTEIARDLGIPRDIVYGVKKRHRARTAKGESSDG